MLHAETVFEHGPVAITDVACEHPRGSGEETERRGSPTIVFVRRGCFVRRADGADSLLDPTTAYFINPGQEERFDHPHAGGDDCTAVAVEPALLAGLAGGDPTLPRRPIRTAPDTDLAHRQLLAAARRRVDAEELLERAVMLVATALATIAPDRVAAAHPSTARARRAAADGAREALAERPGYSLVELGELLSVSPHHLSRIFRAEVGDTIARHRRRLRTREALERLNGGETDLARLSADLGFADHSHLCRVVRAETGKTPSALRAAVRP